MHAGGDAVSEGSVVGIGLDLVEVARLERVVRRRGDRFLRRVFTDGELAYCAEGKDKFLRLAARFAAKEAVLKALGTGLRQARWREVEVVREASGRPFVRLHGASAALRDRLGVSDILLTMTHTATTAAAQAVALRRG